MGSVPVLALLRGSSIDQNTLHTADTGLAVDRHPGEFTAQYPNWASKVRFESVLAATGAYPHSNAIDDSQSSDRL